MPQCHTTPEAVPRQSLNYIDDVLKCPMDVLRGSGEMLTEVAVVPGVPTDGDRRRGPWRVEGWPGDLGQG